jgi:hypothetical protein
MNTLHVPDFSHNFNNMKRGGWSGTHPSPLYNLIINNNNLAHTYIIIKKYTLPAPEG